MRNSAFHASLETVSAYVTAVRRIPPLERDEELELARRFKETGDTAASERLVAAHLRDVVNIALSYRRYGVPMADLIAEGNFGLAYALGKFDPSRGFRFMTYAGYWVRTCMLDYITRSWSLVGGGAGALRSRSFFRLRRERNRLVNALGEGELTDELLAERIGVERPRLDSMLRRLDARDVSLDAEAVPGSSLALADTLIAPENQEQLLGERELGARIGRAVKRALERLDMRERFIAEHRLLADSEEELSLAEIGHRFGISRERARQIEERVKRKLRLSIGPVAGLSLAEAGA